jgi:hypothetical protein
VKRFTSALMAATLATLIVTTAPASAAPSRVSCERTAVAVANAASKPNSIEWPFIYALAYAKCINGSTIPDYRKTMPKRWAPTIFGPILVPAWVV